MFKRYIKRILKETNKKFLGEIDLKLKENLAKSVKAIESTKSAKASGLPKSLYENIMVPYTLKYRGWINSRIPWLTEGSTQWLDINLKSTDRVLEYGGGKSTFYYATKCECITCVEADPDWLFFLMMFGYEHPELMKKLRLYFSPAAWNPTSSKMKPYWIKNKDVLQQNDIFHLERDLLQSEFPDHNIISFDGAIRPLVMTYKLNTLNFSKIDMIIVDNTESSMISYMSDVLIPEDFERLDFPASQNDVIPSIQKGKWMSSIFVKHSRSYQNPTTILPSYLTKEERHKYLSNEKINTETASLYIAELKKYISEKIDL